MKRTVFLAMILVIVATALAHEYVLIAYHFRVNPGDQLEVHLFVADGFNVQLERPLQQSAISIFTLTTKQQSRNLLTQQDGVLPVLDTKVDFTGGGLLRMDRGYARISLPTKKFMDYLDEDHLPGIASIVDPKKTEQKERYTRYIKSLVQSGNDYEDTLYKSTTGQQFEIMLLSNPYRLHVGDSIRVRVLFQTRPFAGRTIIARSRMGSNGARAALAKTNRYGICAFKISQKGDWFIHATNMIVCPDKSDSDWESFWTSYSFAID